MLKGNQRYNGVTGITNGDNEVNLDGKSYMKLFYNINHIEPSEKHGNTSNSISLKNSSTKSFSLQSPSSLLQLSKEEIVNNAEQKHIHSIIGVSNSNEHSVNNLHSSSQNQLKRINSRNSYYHESLQRICGGDICHNQYQKHWFSASLESLKVDIKSREERLEITRYELRRHLKQILRSNLGKQNSDIDTIVLDSNITLPVICNITQLPRQNINAGYDKLVSIRNCDMEMCKCQAIPCTRYCELHIMQDLEQTLYSFCTAKFADNRQCTVPVCDTVHELPLCKEHARKRDNYRLFQEAKPKKQLRKRIKTCTMIRSQKKNKKRKRPTKPPDIVTSKVEESPSQVIHNVSSDLPAEMVDHVLGLQEHDGLELVPVDPALVTQASTLLEETDINTVLSTIQGDEFSDFFTVDRNGVYEPTREESEELDRALEAVDIDMKSLEKLSQTHGLLDTFLDEHTLVESLVQIPDVFHNGYAPCGDNIVSQTSRLLSIEPHSQS